jgi:hypothetical protein
MSELDEGQDEVMLDGRQLWERGWNTTMRKRFLGWKPSRRTALTRARYALTSIVHIEATAKWKRMASEVAAARARCAEKRAARKEEQQ